MYIWEVELKQFSNIKLFQKMVLQNNSQGWQKVFDSQQLFVCSIYIFLFFSGYFSVFGMFVFTNVKSTCKNMQKHCTAVHLL